MRNIYSFTYPNIVPLEQVGGKAQALMQMTAAGMPVPPGLVITTQFFDPWMAFLRQTPEWSGLFENKSIAQLSQALQHHCASLRLTKDQYRELSECLPAFQNETGSTLFAVRSSSPEEDLEGASFAGGGMKPPWVSSWKTLRLPSAVALLPHSMSGSFYTN